MVNSFDSSLCMELSPLGTKSSLLCTPLMGIAKGLGSIGRASEATETYHHVIKILESSRGEGKELILPLSALGNLLQKEGNASDAEYAYNRSVLCIMNSG